VLRNALLPIVTMTGMDLAVMLGSTIFVESVFGLQGLGGLMKRSVETYDLPVILGILMVTTTAVVVFNLIVDIVYVLLDPRVRPMRGEADDLVTVELAPRAKERVAESAA
jgi:peptide/nickel transport system permease protein